MIDSFRTRPKTHIHIKSSLMDEGHNTVFDVIILEPRELKAL